MFEKLNDLMERFYEYYQTHMKTLDRVTPALKSVVLFWAVCLTLAVLVIAFLVYHFPLAFAIVGLYVAIFIIVVALVLIFSYKFDPKRNDTLTDGNDSMKLKLKDILRQALSGQEIHFGIPKTTDKGFIDVRVMSQNNVKKFRFIYTRLPRADKLTRKSCMQLRKILSTEVAHSAAHNTYGGGFTSFQIYVVDVFISEGDLVIEVVPIDSKEAKAESERLEKERQKFEFEERYFDEGLDPPMDDEDLHDDEL